MRILVKSMISRATKLTEFSAVYVCERMANKLQGNQFPINFVGPR